MHHTHMVTFEVPLGPYVYTYLFICPLLILEGHRSQLPIFCIPLNFLVYTALYKLWAIYNYVDFYYKIYDYTCFSQNMLYKLKVVLWQATEEKVYLNSFIWLCQLIAPGLEYINIIFFNLLCLTPLFKMTKFDILFHGEKSAFN